MNYTKTPPTTSDNAYFRIQNAKDDTDQQVAYRWKCGKRWLWNFAGSDYAMSEHDFLIHWLVGPEVTFEDEPSIDQEPSNLKEQVEKGRQRRLFELAFFAAMQGDWANDAPRNWEGDDTTPEFAARQYKIAAEAAVKVLSERSEQFNAVSFTVDQWAAISKSISEIRKMLPIAQGYFLKGQDGWGALYRIEMRVNDLAEVLLSINQGDKPA